MTKIINRGGFLPKNKDQTLLNELKEWLASEIKYFETLETRGALERKFAYQNVIMKINDLQGR